MTRHTAADGSSIPSASRWKFPNTRYQDSVGKALRLLTAEPVGFLQGARTRTAAQLTERQRQTIRREKQRARSRTH